MYTTEEIDEIFAEKRPLIKKGFSKNERHPPEYTEVYRKTVDLYEKIRPHAEDEYFPEKLFARKAPNEKPEEFEYRKTIFKLIGGVTYPYWSRAEGVTGRIWNEKNYSIKYPIVEAEELQKYSPQDYFEREYPQYVSIEAQFKSVITPTKLSDANAYAVVDVLPSESETELPRPYVRLYGCYDVIGFEPGKWLLALTKEKSVVTVAGKKAQEGLVFRFYDQYAVYVIKQVGKKEDYKFSSAEPEYEYNLDRFYGDRLRGKPKNEKQSIYYESYFQAAVPSLNEAILDASNLQISKINSAFPERWEYVDPCDFGCDRGWIYDDGHYGDISHRHTCTGCGGTGLKNWSSPMSVIQVQAPNENRTTNPGTNVQLPPAGYVSKSSEVTGILEFMRGEIESRCVTAFQMLNIDVSNSDVKGSDTALGKMIDREELFSFMLTFSNEVFALMEFMINGCGKVRYGNNWKPVEIGYPQNFAIRSDSELTEEISNAKNSKLPGYIVNFLTKQYIGTRFNSQADVERINELVQRVDSIAMMDDIAIATRLSLGLLPKWKVILHDAINYFVEKAVRDNEGFWEKTPDEQENILVQYAKAAEAETTPSRVNVEDILKETAVE